MLFGQLYADPAVSRVRYERPRTGRTMTASLRCEVAALLDSLGVSPDLYTGGSLAVKSPLTGEVIAEVAEISAEQATKTIDRPASPPAPPAATQAAESLEHQAARTARLLRLQSPTVAPD